jgi:rhodanese-related sulfurtransferase
MATRFDESEPAARRGPPRWFAPALIGGMVVIAAMVALVLTSRPPVTQAPAATAPAAAQPAQPAAGQAPPAEAGGETHGGLNPDGPAVEVITLGDARGHFDAGTAVFIDVRAGTAYGEGHIPGALTITSPELEARLEALPEGAVIIAYGDSTRPESGQRGAQIFMELGAYPRVLALEGGFQDWRDAGHPVEP